MLVDVIMYNTDKGESYEESANVNRSVISHGRLC